MFEINSMSFVVICLISHSFFPQITVETQHFSDWMTKLQRRKWFLIILECYFNVAQVGVVLYFVSCISLRHAYRLTCTAWMCDAERDLFFHYWKIITWIIVKSMYKKKNSNKKNPLFLPPLIPFYREFWCAHSGMKYKQKNIHTRPYTGEREWWTYYF